MRFFHRGRRRQTRACWIDGTGQACGRRTLAEAAPGRCWRVQGFSPGLSPERRAQLQAYGLAPGYCLRVLQHHPVTVVQIEHTELALEPGLAEQVCVAERR